MIDGSLVAVLAGEHVHSRFSARRARRHDKAEAIMTALRLGLIARE